MAHVRRGDVVVVTKGREKGKRGAIKVVHPNGRVEIEKVMMIKRHVKPSPKNPQGGIVDQEGTVSIANVSLWCDKCGAGRRSRKVVDEGGNKSRVCVVCEQPFATQGM